MAGHYVKLTIPIADAKLLLAELEGVREPGLNMSWTDRIRLVARLKLAIGGKDMRAANRFKPPKVKRERVYLDVRRKPAA